ncbi:MAG: hypothetical protein RLZZ123_899 [Pseudomonadota bacterium]|jgi:prepilin-type N-terminal cleavage/methylation domain-containing protein
MIFLKGKTMKNVPSILKPRAKLRDRLRSAVRGQQALRDGRHKAQGGFTLGELLLVLVIIGVLAVVGFRSVQPIIISGRVQATATDMNSAIQRVVSAANAAGGGATVTYTGFATAQLIPFLSSSNMFRINGTVLNHRLSTGTTPTVTAAVGTPTTGAASSILNVTFNQVHDAACVDLTSLLQTAAVIVSVNGTSVKDSTAATPTVYNGVTASTNCTGGSTNTLVFSFQ